MDGKVKALASEQQRDTFLKEQLKKTRVFRANSKKQDLRQEVDKENGCIYGVSVCTEGEALGHGCWLDSFFINNVAQLGNKVKLGLKARFGHPSMSGEALGTFVGRFNNFRVEGTQVFADLYFDESAKSTPSGDLQAYLLLLAESAPDAFGTSIVFKPLEYYFKKEGGEVISIDKHYDNVDKNAADYKLEKDEEGYTKYYVSIKELWGCDMVDEPAANPNGLFSSAQFNKDKFAVIATQFLDTNPKIADFLLNSPHKLQEFLTRYRATKILNTDKGAADDSDAPQEAVLESDESANEPPNTEGGDNTPVVDSPPTTEGSSLSALQADNKALSSEVSELRKQLKALTERVDSIEADPGTAPIFVKPSGDGALGKGQSLTSWEQKAAKIKR